MNTTTPTTAPVFGVIGSDQLAADLRSAGHVVRELDNETDFNSALVALLHGGHDAQQIRVVGMVNGDATHAGLLTEFAGVGVVTAALSDHHRFEGVIGLPETARAADVLEAFGDHPVTAAPAPVASPLDAGDDAGSSLFRDTDPMPAFNDPDTPAVTETEPADPAERPGEITGPELVTEPAVAEPGETVPSPSDPTPTEPVVVEPAAAAVPPTDTVQEPAAVPAAVDTTPAGGLLSHMTEPRPQVKSSWSTSTREPVDGTALPLRFPWRPAVPQNGRMAVVCAGKGGVGKSTVSAWIAGALGQALSIEGNRCGLLDANVGQFDLAAKLGVAVQPDLTTLISQGVSPETLDQVLVHVPGHHVTGLFGPTGRAVRNVQMADAVSTLYQTMPFMRKLFPWTVVDTPAAVLDHPVFTEFVLPLADLLIVVVDGDLVAVQDTLAWLHNIEASRAHGGMGFPPGRTVLLANGTGEQTGVTGETIKAIVGQTGGSWPLIAEIPRMDDIAYAANHGNHTPPLEAVNELARILNSMGAPVEHPDAPEPEPEPEPSGGIGRKIASLFKR